MTEFHYQMDFDGLNLTAEERRELETYHELKGTVTQRFDREKGLCYADGHLDIGGMGFDFKVYADGDRVILFLPTFCLVTGMRRPKRYGVSRCRPPSCSVNTLAAGLIRGFPRRLTCTRFTRAAN